MNCFQQIQKLEELVQMLEVNNFIFFFKHMGTFKMHVWAYYCRKFVVTPWIVKAQTITKRRRAKYSSAVQKNDVSFFRSMNLDLSLRLRKYRLLHKRTDIENKFCSSTELMYFCVDNLVGLIMKDTSLSLAQKRYLSYVSVLKTCEFGSCLTRGKI